jgi:hypothetical protein
VGGWAALIAGILFRRWLGAEVMLLQNSGILRFAPVPENGSVADWFALLQGHPLVGLALLDAFDIVNYALVGLVFLALYAALRRANRSAMTLALALCLVGVAVYFASNHAFAMLSLSNQYAAATTDTQRSMLLAAGQALLAMDDFYQGGGGVNLSFYLVTLAGLIIAVVMRRGDVFNKATAYVGIVANAFGLGVLLTLAFAPLLTFIPLSASAPFLLVWYILIGLRLLRLGRLDSGMLSHQS